MYDFLQVSLHRMTLTACDAIGKSRDIRLTRLTCLTVDPQPILYILARPWNSSQPLSHHLEPLPNRLLQVHLSKWQAVSPNGTVNIYAYTPSTNLIANIISLGNELMTLMVSRIIVFLNIDPLGSDVIIAGHSQLLLPCSILSAKIICNNSPLSQKVTVISLSGLAPSKARQKL
jgi:hypothetical protein